MKDGGGGSEHVITLRQRIGDPGFRVGSEVREVRRLLINSLAVELGAEGSVEAASCI